jgi:hypothetical protein
MSKLGHEQPEFDNRAFPEDSLFSPEIRPSETLPLESPQETEETGAITPVADIMDEHQKRVEERAARWQELTDKNWPPGRVEERLKAEFPDLITADAIEQDEVARIASRRHASRLHEPRSKRGSTRYISPRDAGPPPHIAEDVRRDQGLID